MSRSNFAPYEYSQVIPESLPKLRQPQPQPCPRVLASERAAKDLLKRLSLIASGEDVPQLLSPSDPGSSDCASLIPLISDSPFSLSKTVALDWNDPNVAMRSPVNLLLPLPPEGVRVSYYSVCRCNFSCEQEAEMFLSLVFITFNGGDHETKVKRKLC